jgi:hypothetical protein
MGGIKKTKMKKNILVLKCCGHSEEDKEISSIISLSTLHDFDITLKSPCSNKELKEALGNGDQYDYLYLSAHGGSDGFNHQSGKIKLSWQEFGDAICDSECLKENAVLLLSCCRGGLNEIAFDMFDICDKILYVCGPRQNIQSAEAIIGFEILLFNMVYRDIDPIVACEKIKLATDIRFKCFDRLETQSDPAYLSRLEKQSEENEDYGNWPKVDIEGAIKNLQEALNNK